MLHDFLETHQAELVARCRAKQRGRWPGDADAGIPEEGVPILIAQLIHLLSGSPSHLADRDMERSAARYGTELELRGCSIEHVVHAYGDVCQAVTELAQAIGEPISVEDFRRFNGSLDIAIAEAVGEFGRKRAIADAGVTLNERLGSLAHELRNLLNTAMLAYSAIKDGRVGAGGATGAVLEHSLEGLRTLIDSTLAGVRVSPGLPPKREPTPLALLLDEVRLAAQLEADARGRRFSCAVAPDLLVVTDRQMLSSALTNLLQNAFKFTPAGGAVSMTARIIAGHVLIDIADECGGLPAGVSEELFRPFEQRGGDRSGVGLGLTISRRSVEANGGTLSVIDRPGVGCVFTIALPQIGVAPTL